MVTLEQVIAKMQVNDGFAVNLLLALYGRQTDDEQQMGGTKHENGVGFSGCDASILSSFAEQAIKNRGIRKAGGAAYNTDLSPKQLDLLRKKLVKYGRQLTDLTNSALSARVAAGLEDKTPTLPNNEVCITVQDSPYGKLPPVKITPLPSHLREKANFGSRREAETPASPELICLGPTIVVGRGGGAYSELPSALVPCEGGFRFKTAKEYWLDGGKERFNDDVTRWITERNGEGQQVAVGGGPGDSQDDPFNF